ncbi:MAG: radical SAM protein [Methanoregula sp.]|uniref:radical SAM/SPASM domain-containing protein n=1 Tax=Methanoregula sp. TaxID=2052170 RepID=UPI003BB09940
MKLDGLYHHVVYGLNLYHKPLLRTIILNISSACNFRCQDCYPRIYGSDFYTNTGPGMMRFEDACYILSDARRIGCKSIEFKGVGEVTLHKDFYRFLSLAKDKGYYVRFPTNGWNLDTTHLGMLDKGDRIKISIDKMHFEGSPDPSCYVARMEDIMQQCAELKFRTIMMIHGESTPKIEILAKHLKIPCYHFPLVTKKIVNDPNCWPNQIVRCINPWTTMSVNSDLSVEPCCMGGFPIDNLGDERLLNDAWYGNEFTKFRRAMYSSNPPKICLSCDRWNRSLGTWCRLLLLHHELL